MRITAISRLQNMSAPETKEEAKPLSGQVWAPALGSCVTYGRDSWWMGAGGMLRQPLPPFFVTCVFTSTGLRIKTNKGLVTIKGGVKCRITQLQLRFEFGRSETCSRLCYNDHATMTVRRGLDSENHETSIEQSCDSCSISETYIA